ncbi:MAG TPA: hypothetical protein VIN36_00770 [Thiobacillus sp.]
MEVAFIVNKEQNLLVVAKGDRREVERHCRWLNKYMPMPGSYERAVSVLVTGDLEAKIIVSGLRIKLTHVRGPGDTYHWNEDVDLLLRELGAFKFMPYRYTDGTLPEPDVLRFPTCPFKRADTIISKMPMMVPGESKAADYFNKFVDEIIETFKSMPQPKYYTPE